MNKLAVSAVLIASTILSAGAGYGYGMYSENASVNAQNQSILQNATDEKGSSSNEDNLSGDERALKTMLENLDIAIDTLDIGMLQSVIKGNGFIIEKSDYERLLDYLSLTPNKVAFRNKVLSRMNNDGCMYYLAKEGDEYVIKMNKATIKLSLTTIAERCEVETVAGKNKYRIDGNGHVYIKNQIPINEIIKVTLGDEEEEVEVKYMDKYLKTINNHSDVMVRAFKQGTGTLAFVTIEDKKADLYINKQRVGVRLHQGINLIDTLEKGDKLFIKVDGKSSDEQTIRKGLNTLNFKTLKVIPVKNTNLSPSDINTIVTSFFNCVSVGIRTSNENGMKNVVDGTIQVNARDFLYNLITQYSNINFTSHTVLSSSKVGGYYTIRGQYSYTFSDKNNCVGNRASTFEMKISTNTNKVSYFSLN